MFLFMYTRRLRRAFRMYLITFYTFSKKTLPLFYTVLVRYVIKKVYALNIIFSPPCRHCEVVLLYLFESHEGILL